MKQEEFNHNRKLRKLKALYRLEKKSPSDWDKITDGLPSMSVNDILGGLLQLGEISVAEYLEIIT